MAHSTSVSYAHSPSVRRRAGATIRRSSLVKAALAFVAALLAAALVSADTTSTAAAHAANVPDEGSATKPAASTALPPPSWLLRDAAPATSAPATAPQERLPLIRADRPTSSGPNAAVMASASNTAESERRAAGESEARAVLGAESDETTSPASGGGPESRPVESATSLHDASTTAELAARLWRKLEALPLFVLLAGVAIAALLLRAIVARSHHGAARPEGVVEVLARYPVGRRQQIVLMRVGRRVIVAHQADRTMRTLSETGDPDEVAELIAKVQAPGRDLFSRLLERRRAKVDPFADAELVDLTREPAPFGAPDR